VQHCRLEAEIEPKAETTNLYVTRSKCIEASVEKPVEGSPPVFVIELQPLQMMDGGKATLECRVTGRPMPVSTQWSRDGKIIEVDNTEFVSSYNDKSGDSSLTINEVFPEDAGVYMCYAENQFGHANTKARLTVEGTLLDMLI